MVKEISNCLRCGIIISKEEELKNDGLCIYCSGKYNEEDEVKNG